MSFPVEPNENDPNLVFPSSRFAAVYEWTPATGWRIPSGIHCKVGYYIYGDTVSRDVVVTGARPASASVSLVGNRWNLIGPAPGTSGASLLVPNSPEIIAVYTWGPPPAGYSIPSSCEDGRAYWIFPTADTTIWSAQSSVAEQTNAVTRNIDLEKPEVLPADAN